jgi:subtilisin family serine protease
LALTANFGISQSQPPARPRNADAAFRGDRILIKPKAGFAAQLANLRSMEHCQVLRTWPELGGIQVLRLPDGKTPLGLIEKYQRSGLVEYAEPDWLVELAAIPNDPRYLDGSLWALHNTGQDAGITDADIDAPQAWNAITSASNIVVAVVDTGARYTHEDLAANMWVNAQDGSHGFNALTGSNNPNDDSGHGSRVAGIIGATGDNGVGVVGVAWRVQIMACKFAGNQGGSISDAIACIEFARTNGASILNASWGLYDYSESLSNAIYTARSADILVVAAAGNDALDTDVIPYYPASLDLDNIISVAATRRNDMLYPLSNTGAASVDLAAPGFDIYSTDSASNNAYAMDKGTSMAAAYVSGACALLRARYPGESPQQIIQRVVVSTDTLSSLADKCVSGGRLNLRKTLGQPEQTPPRLLAQHSPSINAVQIILCGEPNRSYIIEATTNVTQWTAVFTNTTAADGTFIFTDNSWLDHPRRFYRAFLFP